MVLDALGSEPEVLVEPADALVVEIDVEQLVLPHGLRDRLVEAQARHRLVRDLGVHPHHVRMLQSGDEREGVAHRGQEDVTTRLVRLRLEGETHPVALVQDVAGQEVQRLGVPRQRVTRVLRRRRLHALTPAPEHVRGSAQLCSQVDVAHHLLHREAPHRRIVRGERAVLEHRMVEQVGGRHGTDEAGLIESLLERLDLRLALRLGRPERHEVVVMEADAPHAQVGETLDHVDSFDLGTYRVPEGVSTAVAHRP